jgi:hypothetical protein
MATIAQRLIDHQERRSVCGSGFVSALFVF